MNQIVKQIEYIVSLMQDANGAPYYMSGHEREIANRLLLQGKSPSKKNNRYPLIALRLDTSEQMNNGYISYNLNIGIFTNTSKSINAEERYAKTITPILTPIYEEFLYQLKRSGLFFWPGSQDRPPHTKIDRPFWGTDGGSGNDRYIFNDAIDAIEILDLRINGYFSPNCGTFSPPRRVGNINLNGVKIGEVAPFLTVNFDLVNSENTQISPVVSGQTITIPDVEVVIGGVSLFYPYGTIILNPTLPAFTVAPEATDIQPTRFDIIAQANVLGTVYALILPDGSPTPTTEEIKAGQSQAETGAGVFFEFTGLTESTAYDVYVLASDAFGNNSEAVQVSVTTESVSKTYLIRQIFRDRGFTANIYNTNGVRSTDYDFDAIPALITGTEVYVDSNAAGGGNGTIGLPYNNLATAYNSGASIIYIKGSFGFINGFGSTALTRSLKILPYDSLRAEITTKISLSFAQNGTYPEVYEASNPQTTLEIGSVVDKTNLDERGVFIGLNKKTSIADVAANPNSFYYNNATDIVYVHLFDARVPDSNVYTFLSNTVTRAARFNSNMVDLQNRNVYIEGISFYGGNPIVFSGNSITNYWNIGLNNCEFSHAGNKDGILISAYTKGYIRNCFSDYNLGDGFNYSANGEPIILEWECSSWRSIISTTPANNGSTSHLEFGVIRVGGDYRYHSGKAIQDINNSQTMSIACTAGLGLAADPDDYPFASDSTGSGATIMDIIECESLDAKGYRNYTSSVMNIFDGEDGNILTKTNLNEGAGVVNLLNENQVYE